MKTHYTLNHALIAIGIQLIIVAILFHPLSLFGSFLIGGIAGSVFYTLRECYQFFIQGKTHKGRFDWEGAGAPIAATSFLTFLIYLI
jgi:hypothetical protein